MIRRIEDYVDEGIQGVVFVRLLEQSTVEYLLSTGVGHVLLEVSDDGANEVAGRVGGLRYDLAQVVYQERNTGVPAHDLAEEPVHGPHDRIYQVGRLVEDVDKQGVEVERLESAVDDVYQVAQANHKFQFGINVGDRDVDLLNANLNYYTTS